MTSVAPANARRSVLAWIALSTVYVVWGSTYLAIRVGVRHFPPLLFAGFRYVIAGVLLYPIAIRVRARGSRLGSKSDGHKTYVRPNARAWLACAIVGILLLFGGNGGVTYAERSLPSGFAALLVATVPVWMVLFARPLQGARISPRALAGLVVGLAGVAALVGNSVTGPGHLIDVGIVLCGAGSWALGSVSSSRLPLPSDLMQAAAMEMLLGGVALLLLGACTGEITQLHWSEIPVAGWIALAYLVIPGSIVAFTAYGYALERLPLTTVSTYAYVNPVVAVLAGAVFLAERLSWSEAVGGVLVVTAIFIILHRSDSSPLVREEIP